MLQNLRSSSMVLAKLQRHLRTNQSLKRKCDELKHPETNATSVIIAENVNVCEAAM
jgi:hypothetical protein